MLNSCLQGCLNSLECFSQNLSQMTAYSRFFVKFLLQYVSFLNTVFDFFKLCQSVMLTGVDKISTAQKYVLARRAFGEADQQPIPS